MADLADLLKAGEELELLVTELFTLAGTGKDRDNKSGEQTVIRRLQTLVAQAKESTPATLNERAETMATHHTTLTKTLVQAKTYPGVVSVSEFNVVKTQWTDLGGAIGSLSELTAFEPITRLLDDRQINEISKTLKGAHDEIGLRQKASNTLTTVIGVAVVGAKIATRLARL